MTKREIEREDINIADWIRNSGVYYSNIIEDRQFKSGKAR